MVHSLSALKIGMNSGLPGLRDQVTTKNLSFEKILSDTKNSMVSPQSVQGLLNLQRDLYGVHLRVELVSKVADGALSTARRLQQGQ